MVAWQTESALFNEAEGVYDMIYYVGTGKLSFHYVEEERTDLFGTIYR